MMKQLRLHVVIRRHLLPEARVVFNILLDSYPKIAHLLERVNETIPLESGCWGLEDYVVELRREPDGASFELLHFQLVADVLLNNEEVVIRPLLQADRKNRVVSGRHQISRDGIRLYDGIPFGCERAQRRPPVDIPPLKRRRIELGEDDNDDEVKPLLLTERTHRGFDGDGDEEDEDDYGSDSDWSTEDADNGGLDSDKMASELEDLIQENEQNGLSTYVPKRHQTPVTRYARALRQARRVGPETQTNGEGLQDQDGTDDAEDPIQEKTEEIGHFNQNVTAPGTIMQESASLHAAEALRRGRHVYNVPTQPAAGEGLAESDFSELDSDGIVGHETNIDSSENEEEKEKAGTTIDDGWGAGSNDDKTSSDEFEGLSDDRSPGGQLQDGADDGSCESEPDEDSGPEVVSSKARKESTWKVSEADSDSEHSGKADDESELDGSTGRSDAGANNSSSFSSEDESGDESSGESDDESSGESDDESSGESGDGVSSNVSEAKVSPAPAKIASPPNPGPRPSPGVPPGQGTLQTKKRNARRRLQKQARVKAMAKAGAASLRNSDLADAVTELISTMNEHTPTVEGSALAAKKAALLASLPSQDDHVEGATNPENAEPYVARPKPKNASDETWRSKINYRAVECCQEGIELSEPSFPFVHCWDPQQRGSGILHANDQCRGGRGKRKQQDQADNEQCQASKRRPYCDPDRAHNQLADTILHYNDGPATKEPETRAGKDAAEVGQFTDHHDLMAVPTDLASLAPLQFGEAQPGMVITWEHMFLSPVTWQPQISRMTAMIMGKTNDDALRVVLAKRDRKLDRKEKEYDGEGHRIYGKFDAPDFNEDDEGIDDGYRTFASAEMTDARILQLPTDAWSTLHPVRDQQNGEQTPPRGGQFMVPSPHQSHSLVEPEPGQHPRADFICGDELLLDPRGQVGEMAAFLGLGSQSDIAARKGFAADHADGQREDPAGAEPVVHMEGDAESRGLSLATDVAHRSLDMLPASSMRSVRSGRQPHHHQPTTTPGVESGTGLNDSDMTNTSSAQKNEKYEETMRRLAEDEYNSEFREPGEQLGVRSDRVWSCSPKLPSRSQTSRAKAKKLVPQTTENPAPRKAGNISEPLPEPIKDKDQVSDSSSCHDVHHLYQSPQPQKPRASIAPRKVAVTDANVRVALRGPPTCSITQGRRSRVFEGHDSLGRDEDMRPQAKTKNKKISRI